ncbi:elongator complex protein 2 [Nematostella vectensis]|uniref:elongator complex protein 2 n=1 Tax=Nematostella vectensis TaxID=45351 RepID=UPI0020778A4E|nr:elongator complex protein 2 [Nematostella vectensis]
MVDGTVSSSRFSVEYTSVACNKASLCAAWGRNGLVGYGGCNSVVLYRPHKENSSGLIECILNGHKDRVNCVKWINNHHEPEVELVSGSTDKTAIVWKKENDNWILSATLKGHTNAINAVAAMSIKHADGANRILIATASADSSVILWEKASSPQGSFESLQTLSFGSGFALTVDLTVLPQTIVPILACGCEDCKIHLFIENESKFSKVQSLSGHDDWIRDTEFALEDSGDLLLASSSQDCFIRIWRISLQSAGKQPISPQKHMANVNEPFGELKLTSNLFQVRDNEAINEFSVVLESVLSGHEDIVYGVQWQPPQKQADGTFTQPMCLLSASLDKSLVIWQPDPDTGIWIETMRVGGVGGTTLGFYGGMFSPDARTVLGHSFQGAFHLWTNESSEQSNNSWRPGVTIGGHFAPVQDICWEPREGQFLLSVSSDQTTRLHAPWRRSGHQTTWHEIGRPQVHGYDMQCVTMLNRYTLASGAEEKVVRVFKAPQQFLITLQSLCGVQEAVMENIELPLGASVPALGLSNKAVFEGDVGVTKEHSADSNLSVNTSAFASEEPAPFTPMVLSVPPTEDVLLQNTLWPEAQKLYGHGYEIFCVASSPDGSLLATSCKATKPEHACVILWDANIWKQVCSLPGHSLTVTQIAFSHSGQRILSVSRDRSWAVFRLRQDDLDGPLYQLVSHSSTLPKPKQHSRIIWSCSWSHDDKYFITASRDKKVIMWGLDNTADKETWVPVSSPLDVGEPATAVDLAPCALKNARYLAAVGLESGRIMLYSWSADISSAPAHWVAEVSIEYHSLVVKRLRWRPKPAKHDCRLHFASCSADHSVKIFEISGVE